jgi:hypothetical protein
LSISDERAGSVDPPHGAEIKECGALNEAEETILTHARDGHDDGRSIA